PRVEVKLKRFVEADFVAHALPAVEGVELVHGVPSPNAPQLLAALGALPVATLARVRTLRLFVLPSARDADAVPEAHALRRLFAHAKEAGVGVVKVSSNVHFLDGERGLALLRSGLDVLILSVDGASQATYETFRKDGDFDTVARAVAHLCAEKKRLGLVK